MTPTSRPNAQTDAVLIVDAFHEMDHPVVLLRNVARTLKPQGRIGMIDYREGEGGPGPPPEERVAPGVVIAQAAAAGLKLVDQHEVSAVPVFPHLRQVADLDADDAHDRRQRFDRRRRYSGRPENVCGARRVWHLSGHGHHRRKIPTGSPTSLRSPPTSVRAQIDAVARDADIAAVKTGMLATGDIVGVVAESVGRFQYPNLVVDPVMAASGPTGRTLLAPEAVSILKTRLLPLAAVVTPNVAEAAGAFGHPIELARRRASRGDAASSSLDRRRSSSRVAI